MIDFNIIILINLLFLLFNAHLKFIEFKIKTIINIFSYIYIYKTLFIVDKNYVYYINNSVTLYQII